MIGIVANAKVIVTLAPFAVRSSRTSLRKRSNNEVVPMAACLFWTHDELFRFAGVNGRCEKRVKSIAETPSNTVDRGNAAAWSWPSSIDAQEMRRIRGLFVSISATMQARGLLRAAIGA